MFWIDGKKWRNIFLFIREVFEYDEKKKLKKNGSALPIVPQQYKITLYS